MRIECCKFNRDNIRINVTLIYVGSLFIILGFQSLFDIFNEKIMAIQNVKLFGSLLIILGFIMLFSGCLSFKYRRNSYSSITDYDYTDEFLQ